MRTVLIQGFPDKDSCDRKSKTISCPGDFKNQRTAPRKHRNFGLEITWTGFEYLCPPNSDLNHVLMINFSDDIGPGFITLATLSITNFIFGRFFSSTVWSLLLNVEIPQIICSLLQFQGKLIRDSRTHWPFKFQTGF